MPTPSLHFIFVFRHSCVFFFIFVNVSLSMLLYTQLLQLDFTHDAPALQKPLSLSTTLTSNYEKSTAHHTCLVKLCPCDWKNYCLCIFMIHLQYDSNPSCVRVGSCWFGRCLCAQVSLVWCLQA